MLHGLGLGCVVGAWSLEQCLPNAGLGCGTGGSGAASAFLIWGLGQLLVPRAGSSMKVQENEGFPGRGKPTIFLQPLAAEVFSVG